MERERSKNKVLKGFSAIGTSLIFAACGAGANITPLQGETQKPLSTPTETLRPETTQELLDAYLNPDIQTDVDKQFIARAMRFWLETYTTKENQVELYGRTWEIETNIEDWIKDVPEMLRPELNYNGWAHWTPSSDTVLEAICSWKDEDGESGKSWIQKKNIRFGALPDTRFSGAQIENGWERIEAVFFDYIFRTKMDGQDWSDWHDLSNSPFYQYQVKNGEIIMSDHLSFWNNFARGPENFSTDPREERPDCE